MLRYVLVAAAACGGVACIVIGIDWLNPPDRDEGMYYALGDGLGKALGWPLIVLGGLILCGAALALVFRRRARDAQPAAQDRAAPPLPEARAHFRSPDERNGK